MIKLVKSILDGFDDKVKSNKTKEIGENEVDGSCLKFYKDLPQ